MYLRNFWHVLFSWLLNGLHYMQKFSNLSWIYLFASSAYPLLCSNFYSLLVKNNVTCVLLLQKLKSIDIWYRLERFGLPTQEFFHIVKQEKTWRWLAESLVDKTYARNWRKKYQIYPRPAGTQIPGFIREVY